MLIPAFIAYLSFNICSGPGKFRFNNKSATRTKTVFYYQINSHLTATQLIALNGVAVGVLIKYLIFL